MEDNCFYNNILTSPLSPQHLYPQAMSAFLLWRLPTLAFPLGLLITEGRNWGCWQFLVGELASGRPSTHVTSVCSPSPFPFYRLLSLDSYSPPPPIPTMSHDSGNAPISCLIEYFLYGPPKLLYSAPVHQESSFCQSQRKMCYALFTSVLAAVSYTTFFADYLPNPH